MSQPERPCGICAAIKKIGEGSAANFVAELPNSYVVLGDQEFYRGYCIVFARRHAREMYELPRTEALALSDEMIAVAEAIASIVKPLKMNYECLGNSEPHIHWHLFPRFESEDERYRRGPVWERPMAERTVKLEDSDRRSLIASIRDAVAKRVAGARIS